MPADHLSKATAGRKFEKCMEALMGRPEKLYDGAAKATYTGILLLLFTPIIACYDRCKKAKKSLQKEYHKAW